MWFPSITRRRGAKAIPRFSVALAVEALEDRSVPSFIAPASYPGGGRDPAVGDFNNDGHADLVALNYPSDSVSVRLGNGDGTLQAPLSSATGPSNWMAIGEFNGDGNLDVVTANTYDLSVLLGNGDGTFQAPRSVALPAVGGYGQQPNRLAVGDVNGDARTDLVVVADGAPAPKWSVGVYEKYVNVLLGRGDGSFANRSTTLLANVAYGHGSVALGDFNGDGKQDVVTSAETYSSKQWTTKAFLQLGHGNGGLGAAKMVADAPAAYGGGSLAVADLNVDGRLDFVMSSGGACRVYLGTGRGAFQAGPILAGQSPALVDINRDGKLDLVGGNPGSATISVYLGNGDGTFQAGQDFVAGSGVTDLAVGDFNGDGWLDLVHSYSANGYPAGLLVLLNDGIW